MSTEGIHAVTGAFGYSGKYITRRLLERGHDVLTVTGSPDRAHDFGDSIRVRPFDFDQPEKLTESLEGVSVLYNTYWVRFNHKTFTHASAVENTKILFQAAKQAGVQRVVHVSITNPSEDSPLEYFSGKAELERALVESGLSHAILRPTVLFGREDILINNIAWMIRRLPVMGVFGRGDYSLQPIHVDDLAKLAVEQGENRENVVIDAIGPETFTYRELVEMIAAAIGKRRLIVPVPPAIGLLASKCLGPLVGDVIVTREEIQGLMDDLLHTDSPPAGERKLSDWAQKHSEQLGRRYASELARRVDRTAVYK